MKRGGRRENTAHANTSLSLQEVKEQAFTGVVSGMKAA